MFDENPNNIWTVLDKIYPYFSGAAFIAVFQLVWNKIANRRKENSEIGINNAEIGKSEAETTHIQSLTIQNLNKELKETIEKFSAQTDFIIELQKQLLDRNLNYNAEINKASQEKTDGLRNIDELEVKFNHLINASRRLMQKLNIPYWETDGEGNNIFISDAWLSLFKVTRQNFKEWINIVIEEDRERVDNEWKKAISEQDATTIKFRILDKNNNIAQVESVYAIIRSKNGDIIRIIGVTIMVI